MNDFFGTAYGQAAAICAGLGVLWGGAQAVGALRKWFAVKLAERRERLEAPQKTLAIITALKTESERMDAQQAQQLEQLSADVKAVQIRLEQNADQTATLQNEKLNWAYVYYGKQQRAIPLQTLNSLEKMYDQYKRDKPLNTQRNHVPSDWEEVIHTAPIAEA